MRHAFLFLALVTLCTAIGCAKEREYTQPFRSPVEADPDLSPVDADTDAFEGPWDVDPSEIDDASFPSMEPLSDAGRVDAGRGDAGRTDASVDAGVDASADAQVDAALPDWEMTTGEQRGPVSLEGACPTPAPAPPAPDPSCRAWPWHTPPCYRTPIECAALHESTYCISLRSDGSPRFTGLDTGATCTGVAQANYPASARNGSLAQQGGDVITTDVGVIMKHSLVDGSFDVASTLSAAVFIQGGDLIVHQTKDSALVRYASWDDLKSRTNGATVAVATTQVGAVFGASAHAIAAAWPHGRVDILSSGVTRHSVRLQGFVQATDGPILGIELSDDETELYLLNAVGIWTFDAADGRLLRRRIASDLQGLDCARGLAASAAPPNASGSPRPGYYYTDRDANAILTADSCNGPFNGPRFYGETAGPELLVIGSYFYEPNTIKDERSAAHILVLTSVEPTTWNLSVADGAGLERIIVNGSNSTLKVQSSTSIPVETLVDAQALGNHTGEWPSYAEAELRANLESHTGRKVTEILGCHLGSSFVVRNVAPLCALR